jgi:hypothetical protein
MLYRCPFQTNHFPRPKAHYPLPQLPSRLPLTQFRHPSPQPQSAKIACLTL